MNLRTLIAVFIALYAAPSFLLGAGMAGRGETVTIRPESLTRATAAQRLADFMSSDRPDVDTLSDLSTRIADGSFDEVALAPLRREWVRIGGMTGDPRSSLFPADQLKLGVIHYFASRGMLPAEKLDIDQKTANIQANMWAIAAHFDGKSPAKVDPVLEGPAGDLDQTFRAGAEALAAISKARREKPYAKIEAMIPGVFDVTLTPKMQDEWKPRGTRTGGERFMQAWNGARFSERVETVAGYWVAINGTPVAYIDAKKDNGRTAGVANTVATMMKRGGNPVTLRLRSHKDYRDSPDALALEIVGFSAPSGSGAPAVVNEVRNIDWAKAKAVLGRPLMPKDEAAIAQAHLIGFGEKGEDGTDARLGNYTRGQKLRKLRALISGGMDPKEAEALADAGVVGKKIGFFQEVLLRTVGMVDPTTGDRYYARRRSTDDWGNTDLVLTKKVGTDRNGNAIYKDVKTVEGSGTGGHY